MAIVMLHNVPPGFKFEPKSVRQARETISSATRTPPGQTSLEVASTIYQFISNDGSMCEYPFVHVDVHVQHGLEPDRLLAIGLAINSFLEANNLDEMARTLVHQHSPKDYFLEGLRGGGGVALI